MFIQFIGVPIFCCEVGSIFDFDEEECISLLTRSLIAFTKM